MSKTQSTTGVAVPGEVTATPAFVDRAEWLAERRNGIGASDVAGILGLSPWASPWSVWVDKVGLVDLDDDDATDSMTFGQDLEPVIAAWFERRRPGLHVAARQTVAAHPDHPWARATLDGLILEEGTDDPASALAVFESKYDGGGRWDEIPDHYRLQTQWQMYVTGLPVAYLAVMHMPFGRPRFEVYEEPRLPHVIDQLVDIVGHFWFDHVVAGIPPAADGHRATTAALADAWTDPVAVPAVDLRSLSHVVAELRALKDGKRQLEADIDRDENLLRAALGCHTEGVLDGQVVVSWRQQDRHGLDSAALRADHPDLAERYVRVTTNRVLRMHAPKTRR